MPRATGVFQQKELREKLRLLEEEVARTKAAAEEVSRRAEETLASATAKSAKAREAPASEQKPAPEKKPKA